MVIMNQEITVNGCPFPVTQDRGLVRTARDLGSIWGLCRAGQGCANPTKGILKKLCSQLRLGNPK